MAACHYRRALVALLLSAVAAAQDDVNSFEHQYFADELTARLYTSANECSSALGVSMAFSLLYPGCTGDTIAQVRETLHYPNVSGSRQLVWEGTVQRMLGAAAGQCVNEWGEVCYATAPLLKIANSVWFDDGATLNPDYASVVGNYTHQIDLTADDSPVLVNEWVSDATDGTIESIVPDNKPLFPSNVLMAINSIYLKAAWDEPFEEYHTNLDSFYSSFTRATQVSEAHFMHAVERFAYSHEAMPGYQVVDLPFAESQMSMVFVLPIMEGGKQVLSTDVMAALENLQSTRLALSVPKFKFESKYADAMKDALFQLGIEAPFTLGAKALCALFEEEEGCEELVISSVIQKTVIDINEKGVEAAAVTAMGISTTSVGLEDRDNPVLMVLDHPFQFFIHDGAENLMVFEGRLGAPEVATAAAAAPLGARHADGDFWSETFNVDAVAPVADESTEPTMSLGNLSGHTIFSLCTGIFLALALGVV